MRTLVVALLGGCLAGSPALAQTAPAKSARPRADVVKAPEYDVNAEVTIKGLVEDIHEATARTDHPGLHVMLKTETESLEVHTCPLAFLKDLEFPIEKGEALGVVGSRPAGASVVLARVLTKGQTNLAIRDKTGVPSWTR